MIPHERSLVEQMQDRPFALIGVNTDGKEAYAEGQKQEPVTWRSFADENPSGPICTAWNIDGFPTIFVLDHEGVIRYRDVRGEEMDAAVRELVDKAEKARGAGGKK